MKHRDCYTQTLFIYGAPHSRTASASRCFNYSFPNRLYSSMSCGRIFNLLYDVENSALCDDEFTFRNITSRLLNKHSISICCWWERWKYLRTFNISKDFKSRVRSSIESIETTLKSEKKKLLASFPAALIHEFKVVWNVHFMIINNSL